MFELPSKHDERRLVRFLTHPVRWQLKGDRDGGHRGQYHGDDRGDYHEAYDV